MNVEAWLPLPVLLELNSVGHSDHKTKHKKDHKEKKEKKSKSDSDRDKSKTRELKAKTGWCGVGHITVTDCFEIL